MPQRRLLYLDANRLSAWRWQNGELHGEGEFKADSAGIEAFTAYLAQHRQSHYYLLVDVSEEGFQHESLPHVHGRDRAALLKRKLGQYFFGTSLHVACLLGREKTGRRDDNFLFAALTRPHQMEPWLAALRNTESRLVGLYSLPLLTSRFVTACIGKAAVEHQKFLLVTQTRAGLRLSFVDNGQLHFSRLTPLAGDSLDEVTRACAVEAAKTYHYLLGQRLIERGVALPTRVLAHPAQTASFRASCHDSGELRFEFLDILAAAKKLGLQTLMRNSCCETLFLHFMARHPPRLQFAPDSERRFFRLWQTRFALNSLGALILSVCLLVSVMQAVEYDKLRDQTELMRQQAAVSGRQYEEVMKTLPPLPLGKDELRTLIAQYDDLTKHSANPETIYRRISEALQQAPQIELDRIDWQAERNVSVDLYARFPLALINDERAMKKSIDGFIASLGQDGKLQVSILKQPFAAGSAKLLKSGDDSATNLEAPIFALRIVQKL